MECILANTWHNGRHIKIVMLREPADLSCSMNLYEYKVYGKVNGGIVYRGLIAVAISSININHWIDSAVEHCKNHCEKLDTKRDNKLLSWVRFKWLKL